MTSVNPDFERLAFDAYRFNLVQYQSTFILRRVSTRQGHLRGMFWVHSALMDSKAPANVISAVDLDLNSLTVRKAMAKHIALTIGVPDIPWDAFLNAFCDQVIRADEEGDPARGPEPPAAGMKLVHWRLQPMLPEGVATSLYGEGGTRKSTLATALAISVSSGATVVPGWEPVLIGPVLYLDWEADYETWQYRSWAICKAAGITMPTMYYRFERGPLYRSADSIAKLIDRHGIRMLVVDSMGLAVEPGAEGDPSAPVLRLYQVLRQFGLTSLLIDHVSKDRLNGHSPYGSIYKRNLARMLFRVDAAKGSDTVTIHHEKSNNTPLWLPRSIEIEHDEQADTISFRAAVLEERMEVDERQGQPERVRDFLHARRGASIAEIVEATGLKYNSVKGVLSRYESAAESGKSFAFAKLPSGGWEVYEKAARQMVDDHVH